jgi:RNA polymerase-binding protein DksA
MRATDRERYRKRLVELRERIEQDFKDVRDGILEEAGNPSDISHVRTHLADSDAETLETDIAMGQNQHELLQQIEDALERMAEGTYGTCEECGEAIPKARLEAIPYATYCLPCRQAIEDDAQQGIV